MRKRVAWFAAGALLLSVVLCGCRAVPQDRTGKVTTDAEADRDLPSAEPVTEAVGALVSRILQDALPAAGTATEALSPGERTPVAQLKQAPQALVGVQLELEISDLAGGTVVYRFSAESRRLVALCQAGDGDARGYVMMVLQTGDSMETFLSRDRVWTGKVVAVKIIDGNDLTLSGECGCGARAGRSGTRGENFGGLLRYPRKYALCRTVERGRGRRGGVPVYVGTVRNQPVTDRRGMRKSRIPRRFFVSCDIFFTKALD